MVSITTTGQKTTEGASTKKTTAGAATTNTATSGEATLGGGGGAPTTTNIEEFVQESASSLMIDTNFKISDLDLIIVNVNTSSELGGALNTLLSYLQNLSADLNDLLTRRRAKRETGQLDEILGQFRSCSWKAN